MTQPRNQVLIGTLISAITLVSCATEPTYHVPDPAVAQSCAETSDYDRNLAVKAADALMADAKVHNAALGFVPFEDGIEPETQTRPRIIQPPQVSFPACAASRGIGGKCEVYFNLSDTGTPVQITPVCTHRVFAREAERAFARARFAPATLRGQAAEFRGIMQPLTFKLDDAFVSASSETKTE